jgi:hypothetical protein
MGIARVALNPRVVLEEIRKTLDQAPDANALREIRKTLDEPAFFAVLNEYLRGVLSLPVPGLLECQYRTLGR